MKMIEAKKVVPLIRLILCDNPNIEKICKGMQDVVNIHTIEAEPVRHGRWIDKGEYAVCTECGGRSGTQYDGVEPIPLMTQFCPNCGCRMDGGDDE